MRLRRPRTLRRWVALIAVLAGGSILSLWMPYRGFGGDTFVQLERGSGTTGMARRLTDAGVIAYQWQFWLARAINPRAKLQAGEYRFQEPESVLATFARIRRGDVYHFDFTVPEGSNMFDIARLLDEQGVMPGKDFLTSAADPMLIRDLAPGAKTLEGYLFPATYRLSHSTTAGELCSLMTGEFRKRWKALGKPSEAVQRTVTLASLVEKETGVPDERPVIAGVFENRLHAGMRLGCDPTVIYAALIDNRYRGTIYRSDLDNLNPYNTYQHEGLPPGPIANPGASALAAAAAPAETDYLYFVAKPGGSGHVFSITLAAHDKAVQNYRHGNQTKAAPKSTRKAG